MILLSSYFLNIIKLLYGRSFDNKSLENGADNDFAAKCFKCCKKSLPNNKSQNNIIINKTWPKRNVF